MAGTRIQLKRGAASEWTDANTVLRAGEVGLEMDTGKFKWGDGTTAWNDLDYIGGAASFPIDYTPASDGEDDYLFLSGQTPANADAYVVMNFTDSAGVRRVFMPLGTRPGQFSSIVFYGATWLQTGPINDPGDYIFSLKSGGLGGTLEIDFDSAGVLRLTGIAANATPTITIVDPGTPSQPLSVSITGTDVTVSLATDGGGTITSTVADIQAALDADADIAAVMSASDLGDGLANAVAETPFVGGLSEYQAWDIRTNGAERLYPIPAPADASVDSGVLDQWFDDTIDAPAHRFKARDAAGTLFAGLVAALADDFSAFANVTPQTLDPATATAADIANALIALGLAVAP